MRGRAAALFAAILVLGVDRAPGEDRPATWDFESTDVGAAPVGFTSARGGEGSDARWAVRASEDAPSGAHVLVQEDLDPTRMRFPLAVAGAPVLADVRATVRCKPLSGRVDQACGVIVRHRDRDNYYLARANALEDNVRVYRVRDGKREELASWSGSVEAGRWHELGLQAVGDRLSVTWNGTWVLDVRDGTFSTPGRAGLWTKADSLTEFDDFVVGAAIASAHRKPEGPRAALVVNTQSASVSRVDLDAMKETARFPVGERPYGIAVTRDEETVAVGVEGEEKVKFFSVDGFALLGEVRIGPMNNDHVLLTADGRFVLVANFHSDDVVAIDVTSRSEAFRIEGTSAPHVVKYGPLGRLAYVTCKKITGIAVIDPARRSLVRFHQTNVNPRGLTFSPDEARLYFASFWVDGFFEMDPAAGKVTRLLLLPPPPEDTAPREVTYHGVEAVGERVVLAANEGRSYLDAVDRSSAKLLDRLRDGVSQPCCVERVPGTSPPRALVSNLGDGTVTLVEVGENGRLTRLGSASVGKAPKRVALLSGAAGPPGPE